MWVVFATGPDQGEPVAKAFLLQLQEISYFSRAGKLQSPQHLLGREHRELWAIQETPGMEDNFLSLVIVSPARGDVILDLLVSSTKEISGHIETGVSRGHSDHALMEF